MPFYRVDVKTDEYTIQERDENDEWDAGRYGLTVHGVTVLKSDKDYDIEFKGESGSRAVVLVEHYEDGCTFGSSHYTDVKDIFETEADARNFASNIDTDHGYFGHHIDFLYFDVVLP